ncbi:hypothetical protein EV126DRAFT_413290 [Verticillium dahliae]|nr:hypothetical protein EV126DRAFT_413290 [Verticillium dahliae]
MSVTSQGPLWIEISSLFWVLRGLLPSDPPHLVPGGLDPGLLRFCHTHCSASCLSTNMSNFNEEACSSSSAPSIPPCTKEHAGPPRPLYNARCHQLLHSTM